MTITKCLPEKIDILRNTIKIFKIVYQRKWLACNSTDSHFLENIKQWLNDNISFVTGIPIPDSSQGRPSKEFRESSERSKQRKTMELRKNVPVEALIYAAQMSQRAVGNNNAASCR